MTIALERIIISGRSTFGYFYGVDASGRHVRCIGDDQSLRRLGEALADVTEPIEVEVADWQVMKGKSDLAFRRQRWRQRRLLAQLRRHRRCLQLRGRVAKPCRRCRDPHLGVVLPFVQSPVAPAKPECEGRR